MGDTPSNAKQNPLINLAVLMGSATGRDGIGGASVLASAGFDETSETKRPSVQVGDPFTEKKLIEACLELLESGLAVGVQDLGAAGISCATSDTAAAGGMGIDVDLARIPICTSCEFIESTTCKSPEKAPARSISFSLTLSDSSA